MATASAIFIAVHRKRIGKKIKKCTSTCRAEKTKLIGEPDPNPLFEAHQSHKTMENEDWVKHGSSMQLVNDIYDDQLEGVEDTSNQMDKLKKIWNTGQWSARFVNPDGRIGKTPSFTLTFVFETDTVVGYGQEDVGEFLITGFFSTFSNKYVFIYLHLIPRILANHAIMTMCAASCVCQFPYRMAFKLQFMQTPGGEGTEDPILSGRCDVDFQLEWDKQDQLFLGAFYMQSGEIHCSGSVVVSRTGD